MPHLPPRQAVLLVDHGSRSRAANEVLDQIAEFLRKMLSQPVYVAHMELAEPTLPQAFDAAVSDGAEFVHVFPYFLAPGLHSTEDIPALVEAAANQHPKVGWRILSPLGADPLLADLIRHRLQS